MWKATNWLTVTTYITNDMSTTNIHVTRGINKKCQTVNRTFTFARHVYANISDQSLCLKERTWIHCQHFRLLYRKQPHVVKMLWRRSGSHRTGTEPWTVRHMATCYLSLLWGKCLWWQLEFWNLLLFSSHWWRSFFTPRQGVLLADGIGSGPSWSLGWWRAHHMHRDSVLAAAV